MNFETLGGRQDTFCTRAGEILHLTSLILIIKISIIIITSYPDNQNQYYYNYENKMKNQMIIKINIIMKL